MRDIIRIGLVLVCVGALGGCVEVLPTVRGGIGEYRAEVTGMPAKGAGARIALASLDGPAEAVQRRFDEAFAQQAAAHHMTVTDPASARYLVRGYLNAAPSGGGTGTDVTFVYDVFDAAGHQRLDRITDTLSLPATNPEVWSVVDDQVIDSIATRSADRLAQAVAGMPASRPAATADAATHPAGSAVN